MTRDRRCSWLLVLCSLVVTQVVPLAVARAAKPGELPAAASAAVKTLFPAGEVAAVALEREAGVQFYEVQVKDGAKTYDVEVAPDGAIGEVETTVTLAELPEAARSNVLAMSKGAAVAVIERHEIHGVPRNGTFAPVDPPTIAFEFEYEVGGVRREIALDVHGDPLPLEELEGPGSEDDDDGGDDDNDD